MAEASASFSSATICNLVSFSVIATCFIVKVPQISKLVASGSTKGISYPSIIFELCSYSVMLTYHYAMDYPLISYCEYTFLVTQDLMLIVMLLHYDNALKVKLLPLFGVYFLVYSCLAYKIFPEAIVKISILLVTPLSVFSKGAQILELYRKKKTGQVSLATWVIVAYGSFARILTSALQTGDRSVLLVFLTSASLNTVVISLLLYYRKNNKNKLF